VSSFETELRKLVESVVREQVRAAINELVLPKLRDGGDYVDARGSGLDRATFRRAARELGTFKVGRKHVVKRHELDTWIERQRVDAPVEGDELDRTLRLVREGAKR
jgi:hypothetical protein